MRKKKITFIWIVLLTPFLFAIGQVSAAQKPNILVIWGDDVGVHNISAYNHGIMGYKTPNIDRIAREGAMFTDFYAHQSCTAGRSSFVLGQHPFRTGLLTIGMPGSPHGIPDWAPTIADLAGYSIDPPYDDPHMGISLVPLILGNERQPYLKRDVVGRASFKRRYFLYRNWVWKLVYFAELDLLQLFNVIEDPQEKKNMIAEEPELSAELERVLLDYLDRVEGKTYQTTLPKR